MAAKVTGDFSKGSVVKTVFKLSLPIMVAEIVHITYNIVDRLYIGRIPEVGTAALTGVGVAFPLISLITWWAPSSLPVTTTKKPPAYRTVPLPQ